MTQAAAYTDILPARVPFIAHPLVLPLAVLALYTALIALLLHYQNWDATWFITAGDKFVHREQLTAPITIMQQSPGYDGEFYYRLALDPFTANATAFGITFDNPATRMQRLGYPLLVWMASGGRPAAIPWVMLGLNLAGVFCIAWLSTALARRNGLPAWLGLAPALYPGFALTIVRDTTEIVAVTFALAALALALQRHYWRAAPFAAFAVFTRETTLFYLAGFGLAEVIRCVRTRRGSWGLAALAVPAVVFVAWQYTIVQIWGASSYSGTAQNIGPPLAGIVSYFATNIANLAHDVWRTPPFKLHVYYLATGALCVALCALAAPCLARGRAEPGLRLTWVLYLVLMMCLTTAIWVQPYDFLRAFSDCFVVGATLIMLSGWRPAGSALLLIATPMWLFTAWFTMHF